MLILSRRESEKVLFPKLGITIEVTRVQGRTVRLGIDAPDEIRIIRGELEETADWDVKPKQPNRNVSTSYDSRLNNELDAPQDVQQCHIQQCHIQQCLNAANLAIHLAQNQLRQQLNDNAEIALDHAVECMQNLEKAVGITPDSLESTPVREAKTGYSFARQKNVLCVNFDADSAATIGERLKDFGYAPILLDSGKSLIEFLSRRQQPNLILTMRERFSSNSYRSFEEGDSARLDGNINYLEPEHESRSSLRMFGVGSLQKSKRTIEFADSEITSWFTDPADVAIVDQCFQT